MTVYVLSKMPNAVSYTFWEHHNKSNKNDASGDIPTARKKITIKGGAGLPSLESGFGERTKTDDGHILFMAEGTVTPVSDKDYEILKNHVIFKSHLDNNLVAVLNTDITGNYKAVAKKAQTMAEDPFSLLTPGKLETRVKVTSRSMKQEDDLDWN